MLRFLAKGLFIRHRHPQDSLAFDVMVKGSVPTLQCLRNTFSQANCTDPSRFLNYLDQHGDHNRVLRVSLAFSNAAHAYQKGCPNASAIEFHVNSSVELLCRVLSKTFHASETVRVIISKERLEHGKLCILSSAITTKWSRTHS